MISVAEVQARVAVLAGYAETGDYDPEGTHAERDGLYVDVLQAIADGHPDPEELAAAALPIEALDLTRWYA